MHPRYKTLYILRDTNITQFLSYLWMSVVYEFIYLFFYLCHCNYISDVVFYWALLQHRPLLSMSKMVFEEHKQNFSKNQYRFKTWMGLFVGQALIKLEMDFCQGVLQSSVWYSLVSNLNDGGHSETIESCTSLTAVCVVWGFGSSLKLSALCVVAPTLIILIKILP